LNLKNIKYVVDNSEYVKISREKIKEFVDNFGENTYIHWYKTLGLNLSEKEKIILAFLIESLNFCFWKKPKWKIEYEGRIINGSEALFFSLIKEINKNKSFLDVSQLSKINETEFSEIFTAIEGVIPLLKERYTIFKNTVNIISTKAEKFYIELFAIKSDEELLKYIITNFVDFQDTSIYKGKIIDFNKRAILLVADLFYMSDTINSKIENINALLGCADYGIPRTLRHYGILEYNEELSFEIDNEIEIVHNSDKEIEIRANMIYALELIKEELINKRVIINSLELDNLVWNMGKKNKPTLPYHHTITIAY